MDSKKLGNFGEKIACDYLENKGYKILDKNYSKKWMRGPQKGEIDIVAKKDKIISFIEVKTILGKIGSFFPEEKVNFQKQRKIRMLAESWLLEKKIPFESEWQIDVIGISIDRNSKRAKIRHFKNVVLDRS